MVDRLKAITYVFKQEGAVSIGLAGRKLDIAIANLRRYDAGGGDPGAAKRRELVENAVYLLSAFVIQREALGIRDHSDLDELFGLTPELWNRVGVVQPLTKAG
jgi:hypothetical protein